MAIKFWRLSQSLLIKQPGKVSQYKCFKLQEKRRGGGFEISHTSPGLSPASRFSGNIACWKSYLSLSLFNFFLHSSTLPESFSLHFLLPAQQRVLGDPSGFCPRLQSFFLRQQHMELHVGRQQENSVTRKKTTYHLFEIEKLALINK